MRYFFTVQESLKPMDIYNLLNDCHSGGWKGHLDWLWLFLHYYLFSLSFFLLLTDDVLFAFQWIKAIFCDDAYHCYIHLMCLGEHITLQVLDLSLPD